MWRCLLLANFRMRHSTTNTIHSRAVQSHELNSTNSGNLVGSIRNRVGRTWALAARAKRIKPALALVGDDQRRSYAHWIVEGLYEGTGRARAGFTAFDHDHVKHLALLSGECAQ
jgi:hypothetical protein